MPARYACEVRHSPVTAFLFTQYRQDFPDVDRQSLDLLLRNLLSNIRVEQLEHSPSEVRNVGSNLSECVDGAQAYLQTVIGKLASGPIEQLGHMVATGEDSLLGRRLCLPVGGLHPRPGEPQAQAARYDDAEIAEDLGDRDPPLDLRLL